MLKSRGFRSALNLCVIGALLLPSGGAWWSMGKNCETSASGAGACRGCNRCPAGGLGQRCGCCFNQPRRLPANFRHTTNAEARHHGSGCCDRPSSPQPVEERSAETGWDVCLCGQERLPAIPTPPSRSASKQLALVLLATPAVGLTLPMDDTLLRSAQWQFAPPRLLPRDSQRRLCVWLI
jgi:hypothetical protein